jgi:hypothetical protein
MPRVTLRLSVDGHEEELCEYLCDYADCPNIATDAVGHAKEIAAAVRAGRPPFNRRGF